MRQTVQEIAGAVQWVDDPHRFAVSGSARFLAVEGMIRVETLNFPYNFRFAGTVYVADVVVPGFTFNGNGIHVLHLAAHDVSGSVGSFNSDIEYRMRHVR